MKNRGGLVPFHHQYLIAQFFKSLLIGGDDKAYKDYSYYSFSGIKGQIKLSRSGLHYNSRKVTIVVSSVSKDFMHHLVRLVLAQDEVVLGNLVLLPELAEEELAVNLERETKYVCISPVVLFPSDHDDHSSRSFYEPNTDAFSDFLYETTISRMATYGVEYNKIKDVQKFQVVPDLDYLSKLRTKNKKFARIYPVAGQDLKQEVRGYTFPFTLYAAPEVQDFIFTCGLGAYCHKGFGMLDLANADPTNRTVVYASKEELVSA